MNEWTVVTVIVVLFGFCTAVLKPVLVLSSTIVKLTQAVETLEKSLESTSAKNSAVHARLWDRVARSDELVRGCEIRLQKLEQGRGS